MAGIFRSRDDFLKVRTDGDRTRLPMELDISPSKSSAIDRILFGCVFAGVALVVYLGGGSNSGGLGGSLYSLISLVLVAAGVVQIARVAMTYSHRRRLTVADGTVQVQGGSLLGREYWSEPLSSYHGVRWREFVVRNRNASSSSASQRAKHYQYVDLAHPDASKSVPLFVTIRNGVTRAEWEGLSKLLGVPAIDARGGETQIRAAEDVDKSIRELANEGKIAAEWSGEAAPRELLVDYGDGDKIIVTITARRLPVWLYTFFFVFGGFMLFLGVKDVALLPLLFGAAVAGGGVWYWRFDGTNPRQIIVTRDEVSIINPSPIAGEPPESVAHSAIEAVRIVKDEKNKMLGEQLCLATDSNEVKSGHGISKDALEWLRKLIVSAIASA